jgi:steroid 5-alpha reductase family enzyme
VDLVPLSLLCLGVAAASFTLLWLVSLPLRNSSIVDSAWGPGFALVALVAALSGDGYEPRSYLVLGLVAVWGLRLGLHIFTRNRGHGEDPRYARMRRRRGAAWWWVSLLQVFLLQAVILWIVSLPVQAIAVDPEPDGLTIFDAVGVVVWIVGFLFEAVGDLQLKRFKADPAGAGKVMDRGLWRYTRHPNYFGDATMWWGIGIIAQPVEWGRATLIGPLLMTFLLLRVSGVALLESDLVKRKPEYAAYIRRTNAFIPGPPKD